MACHPTEFFSLTGTVAAAAFSAPPALTQLAGDNAFVVFPTPYELLSVVLTSSLLNYSSTVKLGVFILINETGIKTTYSKTTEAPVGHVTLQNSLVGPPVVPIPTNKTTPVIFTQPKLIAPGVKIALFQFGDTTAGNQADVFASLVVRRAP